MCPAHTPPRQFYFVYSGSIRVEKRKEGAVSVVGYLYPGDYFGELALINDNPRLASCVGDSDGTGTIVLSIKKDHFHDCFEDKPDLLSEFIVRMNGRKVDLKSLLNHKKCREAFIGHLNLEHGMENLNFYEDVGKFEKGFVYMSDEESTSTSMMILDKYVREEAPHTVNLPSKQAVAIIDAVESHDLHEDTFSRGKEEIYNLMHRDLYQRFKKSPAFDDLMRKMHSYDEADKDFTA